MMVLMAGVHCEMSSCRVSAALVRAHISGPAGTLYHQTYAPQSGSVLGVLGGQHTRPHCPVRLP